MKSHSLRIFALLVALAAISNTAAQPSSEFESIRQELNQESEKLETLTKQALTDIPGLKRAYHGLKSTETLLSEVAQARINASNYINRTSPHKQQDRQDHTSLLAKWGQIATSHEIESLSNSKEGRPLAMILAPILFAKYAQEGDLNELNIPSIAKEFRKDRIAEIDAVLKRTALPQAISRTIPDEAKAKAMQGAYRGLVSAIEPREIEQSKQQVRRLTVAAANAWPGWPRNLEMQAQEALDGIGTQSEIENLGERPLELNPPPSPSSRPTVLAPSQQESTGKTLDVPKNAKPNRAKTIVYTLIAILFTSLISLEFWRLVRKRQSQFQIDPNHKS